MKQAFCTAHGVPRYFYLDEPRSCVQCGRAFVFRAAEQKHWYETLRFHLAAVPARCLACRRRRRSEHALGEQIARAKAAVRSAARDPAAHVSLARAVVELHERTGKGDLDLAVAAARRAAALWPGATEALFWEGAAHARAGRRGKARACLQAFIDRAASRLASLKQKARALLQEA